ncbi:response regulator [Silvimonas iriomotensis]|uniref:DNA-binding response regulator n=1 Tax=Silvimonas iriomotensis TaxID=449662 RepID=A0ABQ2PAA8_9NEIS|nr:response regulator [Silvimonas iriomotensis]GGP22309.1 DNA-binding response regulator [Silvimonas iriomotensis]
MIRVLVADDHPLVRLGIKGELATEPNVAVVAEAQDSTGIVAALATGGVDVLVTDYAMPNGQIGDGIRMLSYLKRHYPALKIVVVTVLENVALIRSMKKLGVDGIIGKSDIGSSIANALRHAVSGHVYLSESVRNLERDFVPTRVATGASPKEIEVLTYLARGASIIEIAKAFNRSAKTISTQKRSAMVKLGLKNDAELFRYIAQAGLVNRGSDALGAR